MFGEAGALSIIAMAILSLAAYLLKGSVDKGTKVSQEQLAELRTLNAAITANEAKNTGEHKVFRETLETHGKTLIAHGNELSEHRTQLALLLDAKGRATGEVVEVELNRDKEQPA